jgi:hypothetical protein
VRGVVDQLPLGVEGLVQPVEHRVDRVREIAQLVPRAVELDPPGQVGGLDLPCGAGDRAHRPQRPPGQHPPDAEAGDEETTQRDERVVAQGLERAEVDRRLDVVHRGHGERLVGIPLPSLVLLGDRLRIGGPLDSHVRDHEPGPGEREEQRGVEHRQPEPDRPDEPW